jgi:N6-L-threonylcarbamoyladenine synthase
MIVLGIETSCDETAAAVVADGKRILSSVVSSQVDIHHPFGGVVPELASRKHIEAIVPVVDQALQAAGLHAGQPDAVAVTQGPGLVGCLLVGFNFARAFAYARKIPYIGVNHLEGHIQSVFLDKTPPSFPFVALLASGGHTGIYHVTSNTAMTLLGQTRDDAAGEAFDKVSKMLGLGYPGGNAVSRTAMTGDPSKIEFPRAFLGKSDFDFSFSGLKTAVRRHIEVNGDRYEQEIANIAAGFQEAVVDVLVYKIINAAKTYRCDCLCIVGGVAANRRLREKIEQNAALSGITVHMPPLSLCGDNAVMIAAAGYHHLVKGEKSGVDADVYSRTF